jgi:hypothetical protein
MVAAAVQRVGRRIAFAYCGAILVPLVLLPIGVINNMAGHALLYITVSGSPAGTLLGLGLADTRAGLPTTKIVVRTLVAIVAVVAWIVWVASLQSTPFLMNNGWTLIPVGGPLVAALVSATVKARPPAD